MRRTDSILRPLLTIVFLYLFPLGATWNGVLLAPTRLITLGVMAVTLVAWQVTRWRGHWIWHHTVLDPMFVLWGAAFGISLLANDETWRRTMMALWYVGVYVAVWYLLHDAIANRALKRDVVIDAFLVAALIVVFFGYFQITRTEFDLTALDFPRPGSVIGNPNSLGAFLVVLLALAWGRLLSVRAALGRWVLRGYLALVAVLLIATFSRGAWIGALAALGTLALLWLDVRGVGAWLAAHRRTAMGVGVAGIVGLLVVGAVLVGSLNQSGRGLELRTGIWGDAVTIFTEHPITGSGLFTFGRDYLAVESQPPSQPHSHAHHIVLHIAAELGVIGLAVFGVTIIVLAWAIWRNWRSTEGSERWLVAGGIAAVVGFGVHHLLDVPAMMPLIALVGLIALVMAATPPEPRPITARWRLLGHPWGMAGLWVALLFTGGWSVRTAFDYDAALRTELDYNNAALALQSVIDADPNLPVYHAQQGVFYALAADSGTGNALRPAIAAYERFTELEPDNAIGWANLAALYRADGQQIQAIDAMQNAANAAPEDWQLWLLLGEYAEENGDEALARRAYTEALVPGAYLHRQWGRSTLAQEIQATVAPTGLDAVALAVLGDEIGSEAVRDALYAEAGFTPIRAVSHRVVQALVALRLDDVNAAENLLDEAAGLADDDIERAWVAVGRAHLAQVRDDADSGQKSIDAMRALADEETDAVGRYSTNIANFQYLRFATPRQFVPQLNYLNYSVILQALADALEPGIFQ